MPITPKKAGKPMNMSDPDYSITETLQSERFGADSRQFDPDNELFDSTIIDTINSSPVGRLLKLIGSLPEIRQEKVEKLRGQIDQQDYQIDDNLDVALDRVIEELLVEG